MPQPIAFFDVEPLFEILQSGNLVLTPNRRLASRIRNAYVSSCQQRGQQVVLTPEIYSLNHWFEKQWQQLLAVGFKQAMDVQLLSNHQELSLWELVIGSSPMGQALLRPAATAQQAASAYRLVVEWRLSLQDAAIRSQIHASEDSTAWLQWVEQFEQCCQRDGWITAAQLPKYLMPAYESGQLTSQQQLWMVGFQEVTPLHQALLELVGHIHHYQAAAPAATVRRVQCQSATEELQAAAVWAKQILKQEPSATVAVVVPDLANQRAVAERVMLEVFEPGYNFNSGIAPRSDFSATADTTATVSTRKVLPFNVSAGYPLLEAPVVKSAMELLSLTRRELELNSFEAICHSPFLCHSASGLDHVVSLINACRGRKSSTLRVAEFRQLATRIANADKEVPWPFDLALQQLGILCRQSSIDKPRSYSEWVNFYQQLLTIFGWPGNRRLDSIEYQQVSQWQQALQVFASLGALPGADNASHNFADRPERRITLIEALNQLRGVLSRHLFQPQTAESPLQILGILEASGLQFSHLWLTSMSAQQWPPAPTPNPLLPSSLQKIHGMPHASAEREFRYASRLTEQFLCSSGQIVVSSPATIDENPAQTSPLFSRFEPCDLSQLLGRPLSSWLPMAEIRRRFLETSKLESVAGGAAPGLAPGEKIQGGTTIFASQAACPFRAFARHRLHISELNQPETGLSAADRGRLLHRALELFWNSMQSRSQLLASTEDELRQRSEQAVQYALDQITAKLGNTFGPRFKAIEQTRLEKLMAAWINVEKLRSDFVVTATELRRQYNFAGLEFEARIDRVDSLPDGSHLIIDYKTGKASQADWWGDRPDQPQLPLYAVLEETRLNSDNDVVAVSGIAFAEVVVTGCQLNGAGDADGAESMISWDSRKQSDSGQLNWQQQKRYWQKVLTNLATDFISGKVDVDPKHDPEHAPRTCQYCHLKPVCRISHKELAQ